MTTLIIIEMHSFVIIDLPEERVAFFVLILIWLNIGLRLSR